jgi:hypothetical protein
VFRFSLTLTVVEIDDVVVILESREGEIGVDITTFNFSKSLDGVEFGVEIWWEWGT